MATSFTVMAGDAGFPYEPPCDELPVPVTVGSPTFRSSEAVVVFWHLNCFSVGLRFSVAVWVRRTGLIDPQTLADDELSALLKDHPSPRAGGLRLGFRFSDEPPEQLILRRLGGASITNSMGEFRYWLWPLPTSGDLIAFAEWPARNLAYSEHVVDGDAVRIAATQVQPLWPESHPDC